jgi:hypothetical protein
MKKKSYPRGCTDLGRAFEEVDRQTKAKRRVDYLNSRKEEVKNTPEKK